MSRKIILFNILFSYTTFLCVAQSDSLEIQKVKQRLKLSSQDTIKVDEYLQLGLLYSRQKYDSALYFSLQALELSKLKGYHKGVLRSGVRIANILKNKGEYEQSINYLRASLPFAKRPNDLGVIYNNLGSTYLKLGYTDSAVSYMLKGLKIKIALKDEVAIVNSYINLANFHFTERQFAEAKEYVMRGLEIEQKFNDPTRLSKLYLGLGNVYYETNDIDSAEYYYNRTLETTLKNDILSAISVNLNLGNIYQQRNQLQTALKYYTTSLKFCKVAGDVPRMVKSLKNIANIHESLGSYGQAIHSYKNALGLAKEILSPDQQKSLMFNLSACYAKTNRFAEAYHYYKRADSIAYQLYDQERETQIAGMLAKYKTEQREKELAQQKAINEKKEYQRNIFILTTISLLIFCGIALYVYKRARSTNRVLTSQKNTIEKREQEKELLLRELHHRTKNNLQLVSSLLNLQAHQLKDAEAAEAVKEGQSRVEAMALIHRDLYRRDNATHVNLKMYLANMVNNLVNSYDYADTLSLRMEIDEVELEADLAIPLGLIANELISNSFKHAFSGQRNPELVIIAGETEENELHLVVKDNGKGINANEAREDSFGVSMIHSLVKQLHGAISFENNNGCIATLAVPLRKDELVET